MLFLFIFLKILSTKCEKTTKENVAFTSAFYDPSSSSTTTKTTTNNNKTITTATKTIYKLNILQSHLC